MELGFPSIVVAGVGRVPHNAQAYAEFQHWSSQWKITMDNDEVHIDKQLLIWFSIMNNTDAQAMVDSNGYRWRGKVKGNTYYGSSIQKIQVTRSPPTEVRVISWNLDSFESMPYPQRFNTVFGHEYTSMFDIIATMETGENNYNAMKRTLSPHGFGGAHANKLLKYFHQGQALFWRESIFEHISTDIVPLIAKGVALAVRLRHLPTGRQIVIVAIHLKSWPTNGGSCQSLRNRQCEILTDHLKQHSKEDDLLMIVGDWNEPAKIGNVDRIRLAFGGLVDVYGSTPGSHPDNTSMTDQQWLVDHALISPTIKITNVHPTGHEQYTFDTSVTDHYPLVFDITIDQHCTC